MSALVEISKIEFEKAVPVAELTGAQILAFFAAVECPVQWIKALDPEKKNIGLIVRPNSHALADAFGLHYEVPVICTWHREFQPRTAGLRRLIEENVARDRLERDVTFIVSEDPLLSDKLEKLDTTVRTFIPLSPEGVREALAGGTPSMWFRELLQNKLYARDAFDKTGPVEGHEFFGRKKLLHDILAQLAKGSSVGLYGLRKVGKTSMLRNMSEAAKEKELPYFFVHLDLLAATPSNRSSLYLLWMIAKSLQEQVTAEIRIKAKLRFLGRVPRFEEIKEVRDFELALDADLRSLAHYLNASRGRVVIVIDEIELLFPLTDIRDGFLGYDDFLGYLRGLSQNNAISVMVVGVNPNVSEAQFLGRGRRNPMYGFFSNRYAPPLAIEEIKDMVRTLGKSSGVRFENDAIEQLYASTGGHPALTRKYCSTLIRDRKRPLTISKNDVDNAHDRFLRDESSSFAEMVSVVKEYYPEEFAVLTRVALSPNGVPAADISRQTRSHLEGYQLINEKDGQVALKNNLVKDWFAGLNRTPIVSNTKPVGLPESITQQAVEELFKTLELQLRHFVRQTLGEKYGVAVEKRICMALGQDADVARGRRDASLRRFQPERETSTPDLLDFVYISDLLKVVCGPDWHLFRTAFNSDKSKIDYATKIIAPARNELAHNREMPSRDLMRAYLEATDLLEIISR
jgi:hypothetical protein